ncbi:MAG TPA: AraC family transcriptional regulator [Thermoanaerobaculia bacterium]|nr:AraC family transcriptional regulator [Thermoanaerobaculia bacterium]
MGQSGEALAAGQFYSPIMCRRHCGDAVLSELRHDRRRRFPHHCHERAYFALLLAGSYTEHLAGRSYPHGPMSLAFHPPGTDHHDEVDEQGTRLLIVEVGDALLDSLREESRPILDFKVFAGGEPVRLTSHLYRELRREEPGTDLQIEELLFDLLASSLCRPGAGERHEPAWLRRIEALLRESFREALSLDRLAAEAGVHPGHLTRTFRRFRGYTPGEYLQQLRVWRVCEGLAHPEPSLVDLALEAGFADQSHCTRVFRRLVGVPPGAFRETLAS